MSMSGMFSILFLIFLTYLFDYAIVGHLMALLYAVFVLAGRCYTALKTNRGHWDWTSIGEFMGCILLSQDTLGYQRGVRLSGVPLSYLLSLYYCNMVMLDCPSGIIVTECYLSVLENLYDGKSLIIS